MPKFLTDILKGDVYECTNLIKDLRTEYSIFCSGVIYPVVPKGIIMLRIIPTASHSLDDVSETISAFKEVKSKLEDGASRTRISGACISDLAMSDLLFIPSDKSL